MYPGIWHRRAFATALLAAIPLAPVTDAAAQTAGQIAPETLRPPERVAPDRIELPATPGPQAPPGADRLQLRVGQLQIEGTLPGMEAATAAIATPLAGQTVPVSALFEAAQALEAAYARAGFVLARIVLPAQTLADGGPVRLIVINGRIERLDTEGLPPLIRRRAEAILAPLLDRPGITLADIERRLLLAGDIPGTTLRSALAAGDSPGGSVLIVEARHQLVTGSLSVDNTLSEALGRTNFQLGLEMNSPLGGGEQAYLRLGGWPSIGDQGFFDEPQRNRLIGAGLVVPIGTDGLTFNLEAIQARTSPRRVPGFVETASEFTRLSARLRYPLIRGREATLNAEAAFDIQQDQLEAIAPVATALAEDDLRILRLNTDGYLVLSAGVLSGRLSGSFGLDAFGARDARADAIVPLSRQGVSPDFQKLELALRYNLPLSSPFALQLDGRAQTAFGQALPRSEQVGLASPTGLSTFDSGLFQGDSGYVLRGELQALVPVDEPGLGVTLGVGPYLFAALGEVTQSEPTAIERGTVRAASYGVGVRFGLSPVAGLTDLGFVLEWGRQDRSDAVRTEDRVTFSLLLRF